MFVRVIFCLLFVCGCLLAEDEAQVLHTPSEVHDDAVPSLINLTGLPSAIVNGSVNVITGELCEYSHDVVVSGGPNPYILGHSYSSVSLEEGNLGDGWNFLHHHLLEVFQPNRISYVRKGVDDTPYLYPIEATELYKTVMGQPSIFTGLESEHSYNSEEALRHPIELLHGGLVEKGRDDDTEPLFLSIFEPSGGRLLFKTDFDEFHKERSMRHFRLVTKNSGFTNVTHGNMSGQTNITNIKVRWNKKRIDSTLP